MIGADDSRGRLCAPVCMMSCSWALAAAVCAAMTGCTSRWLPSGAPSGKPRAGINSPGWLRWPPAAPLWNPAQTVGRPSAPRQPAGAPRHTSRRGCHHHSKGRLTPVGWLPAQGSRAVLPAGIFPVFPGQGRKDACHLGPDWGLTLAYRARAMLTRCFCPPLMLTPRSPARERQGQQPAQSHTTGAGRVGQSVCPAATSTPLPSLPAELRCAALSGESLRAAWPTHPAL